MKAPLKGNHKALQYPDQCDKDRKEESHTSQRQSVKEEINSVLQNFL